MSIGIIKKFLEGLLNLILWVLSTYFIVRTFSLETQNIEEYSIGGLKSVTKVYNYQLQYALLTTAAFKVVFFYLHMFYLSPLLFTKKYLKYFLLLFATVSIFLLSERLTLMINCEKLCFSDYFLLGIGLYIFYIFGSLGYNFLIQWRKDQKLKQELVNQKITAELKLLRSQINPHFLFNSLNNLLSVSERDGQKEVSSGIAQLSDMLRYLIYDTTSEKVELKKEIEFIKNYIALNQLRFHKDDSIKISFEISGDVKNIKIAPAMLIAFVENAFKHGINIFEKSFVKINMEINSDRLIFNISNSTHELEKKDGYNTSNSGIGLENVRKRLLLLYPESHVLTINETEKEYTVILEILL